MSNDDAFKRRFSALLAQARCKSRPPSWAAIDLGANGATSPVDTGRFERGSWVCGMPPCQPMCMDGGQTGESSLGRIREGLAHGLQDKRSTWSTTYPTRGLEHGWSQQAPSGMVKLTVKNYSRYLAQALKAVG